MLIDLLGIKDKLAPGYVSFNNPKYVEIDGKYYAGLIIVDYFRENSEIIFRDLINSNINMNISIFYEKQDTQKVLRKITYSIGNSGVNLKYGNKNKEDIDITEFTYDDAKYIRKELQVNNENLYFLYVYCVVIGNDEKELQMNLIKLEGILQSSGMISKRANFREEQVFISCLPIMENNNDIKNIAKRNVLTEGLIGTYPFISSTIFDENGIFIGSNIYDNSSIFVDRFNKEKYKNANMCIFGTSGAGKSFYTKLLILRYRLLGIEQFIIDPEREYYKLAENLDGLVVRLGPNSNNYINIFDIREESVESKSGYLSSKLLELRGFFSLIFGELNEEKMAIIEEKVVNVYEKYGITFDDDSIFEKYSDGELLVRKQFKKSKDMPILEDLYNEFDDVNDREFKIKLYPFVKGGLNFLNHRTNVELNNKLIIGDIYDLGEENLKYGMYIFTELFWDKIKNNRNLNKAIYLDEIWRLIGVTSNKFVASFIYKIFKTIRKFGGSAVAITQDISDLFSLENGTYGKSILNNCSIKSFFSLEEENIILLSQYANISEKEKIEIKSLQRGESLMIIGEDHILAKIESSEFEKKIIM